MKPSTRSIQGYNSWRCRVASQTMTKKSRPKSSKRALLTNFTIVPYNTLNGRSRISWAQAEPWNWPTNMPQTSSSRSKCCRWTVCTQNRCMNTATIQEMVIGHARKLARRVISVAINIPTLLTALPKASSVATVASWITFLVFAGQNHNSSLCNMFIRRLTVTIVLHRPCNMISLMITTTAMSCSLCV